jgi:hypothetical protein
MEMIDVSKGLQQEFPLFLIKKARRIGLFFDFMVNCTPMSCFELTISELFTLRDSSLDYYFLCRSINTSITIHRSLCFNQDSEKEDLPLPQEKAPIIVFCLTAASTASPTL